MQSRLSELLNQAEAKPEEFLQGAIKHLQGLKISLDKKEKVAAALAKLWAIEDLKEDEEAQLKNLIEIYSNRITVRELIKKAEKKPLAFLHNMMSVLTKLKIPLDNLEHVHVALTEHWTFQGITDGEQEKLNQLINNFSYRISTYNVSLNHFNEAMKYADKGNYAKHAECIYKLLERTVILEKALLEKCRGLEQRKKELGEELEKLDEKLEKVLEEEHAQKLKKERLGKAIEKNAVENELKKMPQVDIEVQLSIFEALISKFNENQKAKLSYIWKFISSTNFPEVEGEVIHYPGLYSIIEDIASERMKKALTDFTVMASARYSNDRGHDKKSKQFNMSVIDEAGIVLFFLEKNLEQLPTLSEKIELLKSIHNPILRNPEVHSQLKDYLLAKIANKLEALEAKQKPLWEVKIDPGLITSHVKFTTLVKEINQDARGEPVQNPKTVADVLRDLFRNTITVKAVQDISLDPPQNEQEISFDQPQAEQKKVVPPQQFEISNVQINKETVSFTGDATLSPDELCNLKAIQEQWREQVQSKLSNDVNLIEFITAKGDVNAFVATPFNTLTILQTQNLLSSNPSGIETPNKSDVNIAPTKNNSGAVSYEVTLTKANQHDEPFYSVSYQIDVATTKSSDASKANYLINISNINFRAFSPKVNILFPTLYNRSCIDSFLQEFQQKSAAMLNENMLEAIRFAALSLADELPAYTFRAFLKELGACLTKYAKDTPPRNYHFRIVAQEFAAEFYKKTIRKIAFTSHTPNEDENNELLKFYIDQIENKGKQKALIKVATNFVKTFTLTKFNDFMIAASAAVQSHPDMDTKNPNHNGLDKIYENSALSVIDAVNKKHIYNIEYQLSLEQEEKVFFAAQLESYLERPNFKRDMSVEIISSRLFIASILQPVTDNYSGLALLIAELIVPANPEHANKINIFTYDHNARANLIEFARAVVESLDARENFSLGARVGLVKEYLMDKLVSLYLQSVMKPSKDFNEEQRQKLLELYKNKDLVAALKVEIKNRNVVPIEMFTRNNLVEVLPAAMEKVIQDFQTSDFSFLVTTIREYLIEKQIPDLERLIEDMCRKLLQVEIGNQTLPNGVWKGNKDYIKDFMGIVLAYILTDTKELRMLTLDPDVIQEIVVLARQPEKIKGELTAGVKSLKENPGDAARQFDFYRDVTLPILAIEDEIYKITVESNIAAMTKFILLHTEKGENLTPDQIKVRANFATADLYEAKKVIPTIYSRIEQEKLAAFKSLVIPVVKLVDKEKPIPIANNYKPFSGRPNVFVPTVAQRRKMAEMAALYESTYQRCVARYGNDHHYTKSAKVMTQQFNKENLENSFAAFFANDPFEKKWIPNTPFFKSPFLDLNTVTPRKIFNRFLLQQEYLARKVLNKELNTVECSQEQKACAQQLLKIAEQHRYFAEDSHFKAKHILPVQKMLADKSWFPFFTDLPSTIIANVNENIEKIYANPTLLEPLIALEKCYKVGMEFADKQWFGARWALQSKLKILKTLINDLKVNHYENEIALTIQHGALNPAPVQEDARDKTAETKKTLQSAASLIPMLDWGKANASAYESKKKYDEDTIDKVIRDCNKDAKKIKQDKSTRPGRHYKRYPSFLARIGKIIVEDKLAVTRSLVIEKERQQEEANMKQADDKQRSKKGDKNTEEYPRLKEASPSPKR